MNIDDKFYEYQTSFRSVISPDQINALCSRESARLGLRIKKYLDRIKLNPEALVLDAPCGYGNMLYLYRENGIKCEGIDLDGAQIKLALSVGLNAAKGDIFQAEANCHYAAISSLDFIEHVDKNSALVAINRFHRMIKPGGYLIIRTPCGDSPFGLRDFAEDPTHKWIGTSACISSLLRIAGFNNIEVIEDWPIPVHFGYVRTPVASILRAFTRLFLWLIGFGNPKCLSASMIIVAQK